MAKVKVLATDRQIHKKKDKTRYPQIPFCEFFKDQDTANNRYQSSGKTRIVVPNTLFM